MPTPCRGTGIPAVVVFVDWTDPKLVGRETSTPPKARSGFRDPGLVARADRVGHPPRAGGGRGTGPPPPFASCPTLVPVGFRARTPAPPGSTKWTPALSAGAGPSFQAPTRRLCRDRRGPLAPGARAGRQKQPARARSSAGRGAGAASTGPIFVAQDRRRRGDRDQHAAHGRLVYEKLKRQEMAETGVAAQALLIPEIVGGCPTPTRACCGPIARTVGSALASAVDALRAARVGAPRRCGEAPRAASSVRSMRALVRASSTSFPMLGRPATRPYWASRLDASSLSRVACLRLGPARGGRDCVAEEMDTR